jgi:hypothetical protein
MHNSIRLLWEVLMLLELSRIILRLRERVVRFCGLDGTTLGNEASGEKEADALFSIIAELGVVLRGEHSNLCFDRKLSNFLTIIWIFQNNMGYT